MRKMITHSLGEANVHHSSGGCGFHALVMRNDSVPVMMRSVLVFPEVSLRVL